jgi:hypothetical protein
MRALAGSGGALQRQACSTRPVPCSRRGAVVVQAVSRAIPRSRCVPGPPRHPISTVWALWNAEKAVAPPEKDVEGGRATAGPRDAPVQRAHHVPGAPSPSTHSLTA